MSGLSQVQRDRLVYQVGDLTVDAGRVVVSRAGEMLPLPKLTFDLLLALIERAPNVVSLDELLDRVWVGVVVSPETVSQRVKLLRDALGDDPREPRYVAGVRGRGYRLIPAVERVTSSSDPATGGEAPAAAPPSTDAPAPTTYAAPRAQHSMRRRVLAMPAVLLLLAGLVAATSIWVWRASREGAGPDAPTPADVAKLPARSVAVLPFRDIVGEADNKVLAEGVAESILHQLATVKGLTVIARTSSFFFGNRPESVAEIGRALGARYLLEGSVQSEGSKLRVTAQLVDVSTGSQVWSLQFDRALEDVFRIQDEIALEVARALELALDGARGQWASRDRPGYDAYLAFLRGRALLAGLRASDLPAAVASLESAVALEPGFASAYVLLARARVALAEYRAQPVDYAEVMAVVRDAEGLVDKAIELEPSDGAAYVERGFLKAFTDLAAADADFRHGMALAPSLARAYEGLAAVLFESIARRREALGFIEQARRLDPIDPRLAVTHAVYLAYGRADMDGASRTLHSVLDRDPLYVPALLRLAEVEWGGRAAMADSAWLAEQALALDPDSVFIRRLLVQVYLDLGDEAAARSVIDESPVPDETARLLVHVHRREWREAGEIAEALVESGRISPIQEKAVALALRMWGRATGDTVAAVDLLEEWSGVVWQHGEPLPGNSLSMRLDLTALAEMLQVSGDEARARKLAEEVLRDTDQQVGQLGRPDVWVNQARAAALLLLGRTDEALEVMLRLARAGFTLHDWRSTLELDPVLDPLRADPAYRKALATAREHAATERSRLEGMRREGRVPPRGADSRPSS